MTDNIYSEASTKFRSVAVSAWLLQVVKWKKKQRKEQKRSLGSQTLNYLESWYNSGWHTSHRNAGANKMIIVLMPMDEYQKQKQISSLNCLVKTRKLNTPVCISSYPIYTQRWQPFAASSRKMPWTHLICNLSCWFFLLFFCFYLFIEAILQIKSQGE